MGDIKDKLRRSLQDAYEKSAWHSLKGALDGLTEAEFQWQPQRYEGFSFMSGSIRDILFHVACDKLVSLSAGFGDFTVRWQSTKELPEVKTGTLEAALSLLAQAEAKVIAALDALPETELSTPLLPIGTRVMTGEQFFDMMVEHDLYHAGQIRFIRCLIEGGAPPR